jgi:hypothetical protein
MFALQKGNYEGGRPSLWLKAADGVQALLVDGDPKVFFVPPYVGHKGWVGVYLDGRKLDWSLIGSLIEESYGAVAPRRVARQLAERAAAAEPEASTPGERRTAAKQKARSSKASALPKRRAAAAGKSAGARDAAPGGDGMASLRRPVAPVPDFVRRALRERGLTAAYRARPPYQRNDYVAWITRAKRDATRQKRLEQMLAELQAGGLYMNMAWRTRSA